MKKKKKFHLNISLNFIYSFSLLSYFYINLYMYLFFCYYFHIFILFIYLFYFIFFIFFWKLRNLYILLICMLLGFIQKIQNKIFIIIYFITKVLLENNEKYRQLKVAFEEKCKTEADSKSLLRVAIQKNNEYEALITEL